MQTTTIKLALLALALAVVAPEASAQRRGSIYVPARGPFGLVANKTATRMGDLVTIVISETQDVQNQETSDLSKSKTLDYALLNFDLKPNAFNTLPALNSETDDTFSGQANYKKSGTFSARLTAVVIDTLPNGNLVVSGRREIKIDNEVKTIEIRGVIRRYDIMSDNTVQSENVADARVSYTGRGPLTNSTNRRGLSSWVHDAVDWLWPF